MATGEVHRDATAHRVTHQHAALDPEVLERSFDVLGHGRVVVATLGIIVRVAVPALVERQRAVVRGHPGSRLVPDMAVVAEAVQEQQGRSLRAPLERVQRESVGGGQADRSRHHRPL